MTPLPSLRSLVTRAHALITPHEHGCLTRKIPRSQTPEGATTQQAQAFPTAWTKARPPGPLTKGASVENYHLVRRTQMEGTAGPQTRQLTSISHNYNGYSIRTHLHAQPNKKMTNSNTPLHSLSCLWPRIHKSIPVIMRSPPTHPSILTIICAAYAVPTFHTPTCLLISHAP